MTGKVEGLSLEQRLYVSVGREPFDMPTARRLTGLNVANSKNLIQRLRNKGSVKALGRGLFQRTGKPPRDGRGRAPGTLLMLKEEAKRRRKPEPVPILASPLAQALAWCCFKVDDSPEILDTEAPKLRPAETQDEFETEAQP